MNRNRDRKIWAQGLNVGVGVSLILLGGSRALFDGYGESWITVALGVCNLSYGIFLMIRLNKEDRELADEEQRSRH